MGLDGHTATVDRGGLDWVHCANSYTQVNIITTGFRNMHTVSSPTHFCLALCPYSPMYGS